MPSTSDGPVILAAFANDHSDQTRFLRNLSEEAKRIQAVLDPAQKLCPLVLLPSATLDEILTAFQSYRDRIVVFHYAGHANGFQLLLESSTGGVHRVGAKGLASFLGQQQGLQLVFLNGCSTERQAEDLLNAGVGCVIATTQAIDDGVATDFSARFYTSLHSLWRKSGSSDTVVPNSSASFPEPPDISSSLKGRPPSGIPWAILA